MSPRKKLADQQERYSGTAVIYARYSSHNQRDVSIEQQVKQCQEFAQQNSFQIIEIYADRAISGKTDKRPNFQRMMRDAEKKKFKYVIAWKSNRMGRNMLQAMMNEAKLNDLGIRVLYAEEDFDDTAAGRFALRSMMNVNQFYSENMAEDIKRGLYDNAAKCKIANGGLPLGYKKGDDLRYALDPPNDEIVREIFSRTACGDSFADIAADLNARGIKTSRGKTWGKNSFHALLTNERYTGVYIYGDIRIEGGVPQIVDKGLFFRVQEVLKTKKNPQGRHRINGDYLLTGKLFCGHCKSPMAGISGTGKNGKLHHYYICQKRRMEKSCDKANIRRDKIEHEVAVAIRNYIMRDDVLEWIADSAMTFAKEYRNQTCIGSLETQLAENKQATKNLLTAIEHGIITSTTKDRLLELEREQAILVSRLDEEQASLLHYSRDDIISAMSLYKNGNIEDKAFQAKLFDTFLIAVYLYDDHLKIEFSVTGKKTFVNLPLDTSVIDNIESFAAEECSFSLSLGPPNSQNPNPTGSDFVFLIPPKENQTNTMPAIYMLGGVFVLVY
ncbi:recombinase family protein, partial [Anaerotruncus colihominis]